MCHLRVHRNKFNKVFWSPIINRPLLMYFLGVPLRVGLSAAMLCLYGQSISTTIPNASTSKRVLHTNIIQNGKAALKTKSGFTVQRR
jgi:hypothetical protein